MPKKSKRESQKDRKKRQSVIEDDNGSMDNSTNEEEKDKAKEEKTEEQVSQSGGWFSSWFGSKKPTPVEKPKVDIEDKSETSESEEESIDEKVKLEEKSVADEEKEESNEDKENENEELNTEKIRSDEESSENKNSEEELVENEASSKEEEVIGKDKSEEDLRENRNSEENSTEIQKSEEGTAQHEVKTIVETEDKKKEYDEDRKVFMNKEKPGNDKQHSSSESENEFLEESSSEHLELEKENVDKNIIVLAVEKSHSASESENEFTIDKADNGESTLLNNLVERAEKQNKMKEMTYSSIESENEFNNENKNSEFGENKKPYFVPHSQEKSHSSSESEHDFEISELNEKKESPHMKETHLEETTGLTIWQEAFAKMKSDSTWENIELQENFATMKTKHIDHDEGFGCISNSEDTPSAKGILKETSPFFNNETKMTNFRLSKFHFYSLGFHVSKSLNDHEEEADKSVYLFRHFLHIPSLTSQQLEGLRVVACKLDCDEAFDFIKPVWINQTFICVTQTNYNWFQVVSETDHLPVQMNLVPFRQSRQSSWQTIFICPLPPGRHHIQKMLEENHGWKKCGYEEPCVINKGIIYQFFDQDESEAEVCGQIKVECRSEDTLWVKYGQDKWRNQAFIKAILTDIHHPAQVVFAGQISLYETLRLDEDLSAYDIQHESMDLSKLDSGVLADLPFPGTVTYVDPFIEYVRQGSLTLSQLSAISAHMGYQKEERLLEDIEMTTTIRDIIENWKDDQGRDASMVNFLTILGKSDVSLTNVAMEIYQNITNSQWI